MMKGMFFGIFLLLTSIFAFGQPSAGKRLPELEVVQRAIEEKGARWVAGETWASQLPPEQRRALCGEISPKSLTRIPDPEQIWRYPGQPERFDWREVDGGNWTTPIRNQGGCGSCAAFAAIGAMEAVADIHFGDPDLNLNLSEQHLFSCGCGACCQTGWTVDQACAYLAEYGAPDEACFPYSGQDLSCSWTCSDWRSRTTKISCWNWVGGTSNVSTPAQIKEKLLEGPLAASMMVYGDFNYYQGGVYEHVTGEKEAGHGVVIVGWDDTTDPPCWICKNSWGTWWGEAGGGQPGGWFRIKMGTNHCGIEERVIFLVMGDLPEIQITETFHNFGTVEISDTAEWVLPVTNPGAAALEIYGVDITSGEFAVKPGHFPQIVSPDDVFPLTFTFTPSISDVQAGVATIRSNDCRDPALYVRLLGMGVVPNRVALRLPELCGLPGEMLPLPVELDNQKYQDIPCSLVRLEICFDEALLAVTEVTPTERTSSLGLFTWEVSSPGTLTVAASDTNGNSIEIGTGPIAHIIFHISEEAQFGQVAQVAIQDLSVLAAGGAPVQTETENGFVGVYCRADVNLDRGINVLDLVRAVNIILNIGEPPTEYELWAVDCDDDGKIDLLDVVGIANAILGIAPCQP